MDLVIAAIWNQPAIWKYVFPLNVIAIGFFLLGVGLQVLSMNKRWKWLIFPLICLALSLSCEYIYYVAGTFEVFAVAIFGVMTYLTLFGSVIGTLIYLIWTKVRH